MRMQSTLIDIFNESSLPLLQEGNKNWNTSDCQQFCRQKYIDFFILTCFWKWVTANHSQKVIECFIKNNVLLRPCPSCDPFSTMFSSLTHTADTSKYQPVPFCRNQNSSSWTKEHEHSQRKKRGLLALVHNKLRVQTLYPLMYLWQNFRCCPPTSEC